VQDNEASDGEPGSDPPSDEAENLDEKQEEDEDDEDDYEEDEINERPAKRPRHGGFIIDEAGTALEASLKSLKIVLFECIVE